MLVTTALWLGLAGCVGEVARLEVKKRSLAKQAPTEIADEKKDYTPGYTQLFTNLGLMDATKGDFVKCYGIEHHDCYRLITFKLSDTLSYKDFEKKATQIAEKLKVPEEHFKIYSEKGYMKFQIRHLELQPIPYTFRKTAMHIVPLGVDLDNKIIIWDMKADPHMIIVGTTGSGKSTLFNMIINHIINNQNGGDLYLIDLKKGLELGIYKDTKGCKGYAEDIEEAKSVIAAFSAEADRRYEVMKSKGHRNYNKLIEEYPGIFPRAYLLTDEFADLMSTKKPKKGEFDAIEELIQLARKVRAVGMHIILSTQRPTADSIPPTMKANMQAIICFRVINQLNSQVALDEGGAEFLEPRHCIGILQGKKTYFRTMFFDEKTLDATVAKYKRAKSEKVVHEPQHLETNKLFK